MAPLVAIHKIMAKIMAEIMAVLERPGQRVNS